MSNSQNKKNEQQNNLCTTLTEQWEKGELKDGYYYAEEGGEELIIHIQGKNGSVMGDDFNLEATDWIKPIAPVPSYDEWVYLHKARNDAHEIVESLTQENKQLHKFLEEFNALDVAKENQQLKELLRECYKMLAQYHVENSEPSLDENIELLTKIDNAIGENNAKHCRTSESDL